MVGALPSLALVLLAAAMLLAVGRQRSPGLRARFAVVSALVALSAPFVVTQHGTAAGLLAGFAIVVATRAWEVVSCPGLTSGPWLHALLWALIPSLAPARRGPTRHPEGPARAARRRGAWLLLRACLKGAALLMAEAVLTGSGSESPPYLGKSLLLCLAFAGALTALADAVTGVFAVVGFETREVFCWPLLAPSPADFWSRRWNLYMAHFFRQHIYVPLGGRKVPWRATLGVFVLSGLLHEYFVLAVSGCAGARLGWMMAFFLLQSLAVMLNGVLRRALSRRGDVRRQPLSQAVSVAAHVLWMVATAPVFFVPLAPMLRQLGFPEILIFG